jgi:hypothetical protein
MSDPRQIDGKHLHDLFDITLGAPDSRRVEIGTEQHTGHPIVRVTASHGHTQPRWTVSQWTVIHPGHSLRDRQRPTIDEALTAALIDAAKTPPSKKWTDRHREQTDA